MKALIRILCSLAVGLFLCSCSKPPMNSVIIECNQCTNLAEHSIILCSYGVTVTNDFELAFGGCVGAGISNIPAVRVRMTQQEEQTISRVLRRAYQ